CEHAGISSEVITGYARCCPGPVKFRTNHSWNAVRIDNSWYLVDVTWGSGYVDQYGAFVQRMDENYFLAKPEQFIRDHFPDDLRWSLLNEIPELHEFRKSPFMNKDYVKYSFGARSHQKGAIETGHGDTLHLEIEVRDPEKDMQIAANSFFDSAVLTHSPASVFLEPALIGKKASYTYVASDPAIQWIHLIYNGDIVLRYRLQFKKERNLLAFQSSKE
ncbi:MAG: transglutaminase domain-containing protein, partial [Flavitalea sp.]